MTSLADSSTPEPPTRAAVLVVHGIGEQAPYATLDRVVRGLRTVLGERVDHMSQVTAATNGRVVSGVRISLNTTLPRSGARELDVFEGYWAPMARGLINLRGVTTWLRQVLMTPFRRWSQVRLDNVSLGRRLELVIGEIFAAIFFFALIVAGAVGAFSLSRAFSRDTITEIDWTAWAIVEVAAIVAALAFFLQAAKGTFGPLVGRLRRWAHHRYVSRILKEPTTFDDAGLDDSSIGQESRRIWSEAAWIGVALTGAVVAIAEIQSGVSVGTRISDDITESVSKAEILPILIGVAIAVSVGRFLSSVVGDVALYAADDIDSSAGRFRTHILTNVQRQLRALLEDPTYATVHIVSHSLGTVISYDAVNLFRNEVEHVVSGRSCDDEEFLSQAAFDRIGSLVTVACPLDHIDYFSRSTGSASNPIQRELLERRRGLRANRSFDDAGRFSLDEEFATATRSGYYPLEPTDFAWLNLKATPDPIGTQLLSYQPDETRRIRFSPLSLSAHTGVLKDRRTYEAMLAYL